MKKFKYFITFKYNFIRQGFHITIKTLIHTKKKITIKQIK